MPYCLHSIIFQVSDTAFEKHCSTNKVRKSGLSSRLLTSAVLLVLVWSSNLSLPKSVSDSNWQLPHFPSGTFSCLRLRSFSTCGQGRMQLWGHWLHSPLMIFKGMEWKSHICNDMGVLNNYFYVMLQVWIFALSEILVNLWCFLFCFLDILWLFLI